MPRRLNVALAPGSPAHLAFNPPTPSGLAPGFSPQSAWNLSEEGGRTIADLIFVNCYAGVAGAWADEDVVRIDKALASAFTDAGLQSVIAQYYKGTDITSKMLPSTRHPAPLPPTVHKNDVEALARELYAKGVLGGSEPADSVINIMLPKGTVLSSEPTGAAPAPGGREGAPEAPPGEEAAPEAPRGEERAPEAEGEEAEGVGGVRGRAAGAVNLDADDAVESTEGLGGYHGSVRLEDGTKIYYAVGVYSEGSNGIAAFDESWKNVVATFYHELNEARTDPDVEEVNASGNNKLLGWYSATGQGEIGDLPINASGGSLGLVFKEVALADGSGTVPIQIMWSNEADGPATSA
jgi:hypothetical protein